MRQAAITPARAKRLSLAANISSLPTERWLLEGRASPFPAGQRRRRDAGWIMPPSIR